MPSRGRAALGGIAVVVLFLLPLLPEALGKRRLVFRDAQITHWPWRRVAAAALAEGDVPFVNAFASGGQPLLANPNAVLLYPTFLLEKVLPGAAAFNWHYLVHVLWAFFGARLLARRLGLAEGPALFTGIAFAFSGMMLSYGSAFMNSSAAASWLPWCAAAALDLARARGPRRILRASAASGLALGLQLLAGEPALSLLTLAFIAFLALAEAWAAPSAERSASLRALLLGGMVAGLLGLALAAPLLLPLSRVFPYTYRGLHLYSEKAFGAAPFTAARAIEWLLPRFGGDPGTLGGGAGWLRPEGEANFVYIWCLTLGVVPLLVILVAALRRDFWHRRTFTFASIGLVTLLFSAGFALPFYRLLYTVESLRRLRYPIKFYLLATLCFALLAGFAAESLGRRRARGSFRREAVALAAALAVFAAAWLAAGEEGLLDAHVKPVLARMSSAPSGFLPAFRSAVRGDALLGIAATLLVGLLVLPHRPHRGRAHVLGISTLLFALVWALPLFVSASEKELERPPALLPALGGSGRLYVSRELPRLDIPALEKASDHPAKLPRVAKAARVLVEQLTPLTAARYGVRYVFENDPDGSYGYFNRLASEAFDASTPAEKSRLLKAYGARWILSEESVTYPFAHPVTGFAVAGTRLLLQELADPLSELRWAGRAYHRRSLSGALELVRSDGFDAASEVVLPGGSDSGPAGETRTASVSIQDLRPDRAAALVTASSPGHLVFSRTYFPAWKASLDGNTAPVRVANARELAVAVPPGRHRVELWYDRGPFHRGVSLQGAALLLAATLAAFTARR